MSVRLPCNIQCDLQYFLAKCYRDSFMYRGFKSLLLNFTVVCRSKVAAKSVDSLKKYAEPTISVFQFVPKRLLPQV
jgi:hypothetical protein